jgi:kynureninase
MHDTSARTRPDPLLLYRDRFPILARTNYLISNSLGAVPRDVYSSVQAYVDLWAERGVRAWEEAWWTLSSDLGNELAPLIGAQPGEVVFQPNVTIAHAVLFSAFEFGGQRPKVVTDAMHFPSILYLLSGCGARVEMIPSTDGITVDTGRIVEAIDESTAFVNLSHVLFKSAYIHDIPAITARAREVGAITIIDGYQSVGTIPVDVRSLGVDFYIGGCLKWLCGGPGAAFTWIRPDLAPMLSPRLTGWMAHANPFAFSPTLERRNDAWRFLHGTPNIPALYAARPGIRVIKEVGIEAIRAKSMWQIALLVELARSRGFACTTPEDPNRRGGTVAIAVDHGYEVSRALKAREIICDYRPGAGVRLSPHFYTRDDELNEAIEAIEDILHTSAWQPFAATTTVT